MGEGVNEVKLVTYWSLMKLGYKYMRVYYIIFSNFAYVWKCLQHLKNSQKPKSKETFEIAAFYRWGNWGPEPGSDLSSASQWGAVMPESTALRPGSPQLPPCSPQEMKSACPSQHWTVSCLYYVFTAVPGRIARIHETYAPPFISYQSQNVTAT